MNHDIGGWLWFLIDVLFVVVLAAAMVYGSLQWRRWKKRPAQAAQRERAAEEAFRSEKG